MRASSLALLGRNGTGKTTLINTLVGVTRRHAGAHRARRARDPHAAAARARGGRHRLGAAGAQHLQVAHGGREPDRGRAPRAVDRAARLRDVPAPGRAQAQPRHAAVGRRAADARVRPRAGAEPASCCCSTSRSKAWRRSSWRSCCARSRAWRATKACRRSSSSSTRTWCSRSPTRRSCSTAAASRYRSEQRRAARRSIAARCLARRVGQLNKGRLRWTTRSRVAPTRRRA